MGAALFLFGDFGGLDTDTLETNAVPWKVVTAALVIERRPNEPPTQDHLREILSEYGFIYPRSVRNWPLATQPEFEAPLGIVVGDVTREIPKVRIEVANLGCASCHSGVTYDAQGQALDDVWLGLPNTSLDIDTYVDAVVGALRAATAEHGRLLTAVVQLYPTTSKEELESIETFVWPKLLERLSGAGTTLPFRNGGPGRSNGVAALKFQLGLLHGDAGSAATVSIPELGEQTLRSAVLVDGIYTHIGDSRFTPRTAGDAGAPERLAEIVAFFTVPTMGLHPDRAARAIAPVGEVMQFLAGYEAPAFPAPIDPLRAARGAHAYAARCAECHGSYDNDGTRPRLLGFPNRRSDLSEIGSDAERVTAVDASLVTAVEHSAMGRYIDAERTDGYMAPALSGVWATAPYLHNGSVPTIWHLMHPDARPARFWVGGHMLDYAALGIAGRIDEQGVWVYPDGYRPWSNPRLFDTAALGHSNAGHEREFNALTEEQKIDLVEYLKRL